MKVKVECPCGTRFEFEVQPVNNRMPVAINCPGCNADATGLANEVIAQQSADAPAAVPVAAILPVAAAAPVAAPAPVMPAAAPPPPPPPPAPGGLRISKSAAHAAPAPVAVAPAPAPAAAPVDDGSVQFCPKHRGEPAVNACVVCHKPLCLKCMEQFGHVCSVFCRQQAEQKRIYIPVYAGQKSVLAEKSSSRSRTIFLAATAGVVAILGLWFYYAWFAREPKIVYRLSLGSVTETFEQRALRPEQYFKLVAPGQLLTLTSEGATLLDIPHNKTLWTTPLSGNGKGASKSARFKHKLADLASDDEFGFYGPEIVVSSNDIWINLHSSVVCLDRKTGSAKESPIHGQIASFVPQGDSLVAVFTNPDGQKTLAQVNLADGSIKTAPITEEDANPIKALAGKKQDKKATTRSAPTSGAEKVANDRTAELMAAVDKHNAEVDAAMADDNDPTSILDEFEYASIPRFIASGSGVVQLQRQLLEKKTVSHQAMKPKGKSVLDGNVTASQGLELAQEMMNDARRDMTGGVDIENISRYQVTLHRWFSENVPDWTAEVTGPPRVFALKTIDLVIAGQSVIAIDRNNKKLWEGKLSYPMNYLGAHAPVLETKDAVYVADPGVLTCFDLATGNARWRMNSVGISAIRADSRGRIFVNTTDAGPEKIKYSQQINVHEHIHPVILSVAPANGKVLWRVESIGDECLMSGKFLYTSWVTMTQSALKLEEGPDTHFNLNLLNPGSGSIIWNFHVDNQHIVQTDVAQNWILLRFADKLYVLKFFSL